MGEAIDLDAIEAREAAATPGPWEHMGTSVTSPDLREIANTGGWKDGDEDNAAFIAHARTDIPALTAEVRRLRATNKRLRAENKRLQTAIDTSCDDYLDLPRSSRDGAF